MIDRFKTLHTGEIRVLTFQFGDDLESEEALVGDPVVEVHVIKGDDVEPLVSLGVGIPQVQGSDVLLRVAPTVSSVEYFVKVLMDTNNPDKRLACGGRLPIEV